MEASSAPWCLPAREASVSLEVPGTRALPAGGPDLSQPLCGEALPSELPCSPLLLSVSP